MKYFLLVYDRPQGRLVEKPRVFSNHLQALEARFELEQSDHDTDHEVVVIGGETLESLKTTHSRYFERSDELV